MISHEIIKRTPAVLYDYTSHKKEKYTQEELDQYLTKFPFKKGDLIFYVGRTEYNPIALAYISQLYLVTKVVTGLQDIKWRHGEKFPEVMLIRAIGGEVVYPAWNTFTRMENEEGWSKLTKKQYQEYVDDRVQDYLKKNNLSWNIPE